MPCNASIFKKEAPKYILTAQILNVYLSPTLMWIILLCIAMQCSQVPVI